MKKVWLLVMVSVVFLLTGCMQIKSDVVIHKDGKIDAVQYVGMSQDMVALAELSGQDTDEIMKEEMEKQGLEKQGYKVESYSNDDFMGMKVSKTFNSVEELFESELFVSEEQPSPYAVEVRKGWFQTITTIKGNLDFNSELVKQMDVDNIPEDERVMVEMMMKKMDVSFDITTPSKAISHNADEENGNTYTWKLDLGKDEKLELEYKTINDLNIVISVGIVVVIALFLTIFVFNNKKEEDRFE